MFTERYGLILYIQQITFRLYKVKLLRQHLRKKHKSKFEDQPVEGMSNLGPRKYEMRFLLSRFNGIRDIALFAISSKGRLTFI